MVQGDGGDMRAFPRTSPVEPEMDETRQSPVSPQQRRRCLLFAGLLFFSIALGSSLLWQVSVRYMNIRMHDVSAQNCHQIIDRLGMFLAQRLATLRQVSHFYANSENIQESEFQGFATALLADMPGILAVLVTDRVGHPIWMAPANVLPMNDVYLMTADPKLAAALARSGNTLQPVVTSMLDVPGHGDGFLAAAPIYRGRRHLGYTVGIFYYQSLLSYLMQPDQLSRFRVSILFYRRQIRTLALQSEARASRTRLERTGLNLVRVKSELELILNSVDEGIIIYNEALEPVEANSAFLASFGLTEGSPAMFSAHVHHEHMIQWIGSEAKYWSVFNAMRTHPEQVCTDEIEVAAGMETRGGGRLFRRKAMVVCGADGASQGVLMIYKDATAAKAIDQVKDEFLSNVTHELRSPLASIKGFAETMQRDVAMPPETRQEFISIIYEESTRLQNLIEEILDLRRLEAQGAARRIVPYDLRVLTEEIVRGARTILFSKNITARISWEGSGDSQLNGDISQITRALRNLIVNAVKYSPEGGEILLKGASTPDWIYLEVIDLGGGIADKDLPHIFDKFYRGTRQGGQKGTGLGLAIVKHTIENHGGHLGVRSEVGYGTTFRIELPRNFEPPIEAVDSKGNGASPVLGEAPLVTGKAI